MDTWPDPNLQRYLPHIKQQMLRELLTNKLYGRQEWLQLMQLMNISGLHSMIRLILLKAEKEVEPEDIYALANVAEEILAQEGLFAISTTIGHMLVIVAEDGSTECMLRSVQWLRHYYKRYDQLNFMSVITDAEDIKHIRRLYREAVRDIGETRADRHIYPYYLPSEFLQLHEAAYMRESPNKQASSEIVVRMIRYVHDHLSDPSLSLSKLSKEVFFMNGDYLGKLFRQQTGERFSHYVMRKRIQKAAHYMAVDKQTKILDIAAKVGFSHNVQYFSQVFKKLSGCSPSEYRDRLKRRA